MQNERFTPHNNTSEKQKTARETLYRLFKERPFGDVELLTNFGLFARSSALSKLFFLHEAYQKAIDVPGDIWVLGTWLGQDLVVFESMRAMLEPYNASRAFVGFDTFDGYKGISDRDQGSDTIKRDGYATPKKYKEYLEEVLAYHRSENTMGHAVRHRLIEGDVRKTVHEYLEQHQETLIALAYFDLAVFEPTLEALKAMEDRLLPGSVLVFDELNDERYPGEGVAARQWLKSRRYKISRSKILPDRSFVTIE